MKWPVGWRIWMSKTIEVDCSAWLTSKGVEVSCYIGDACEPIVESTESFEDLIEKELYAHTIMSTGKFSPTQIDSVHEFLDTLKRSVEYTEKRIKELTPDD